MAANIYRLLYSPGVQRDGTTFQGTYCTEAQWIRFQRDKIKKIGGMKGVNINPPISNVTAMRVYPTNERNEIITFLAHRAGIFIVNSNSNWNTIRQRAVLNFGGKDGILWETETVTDVTDGKKTYAVFMLTQNGVDINQNSPSSFFRREITADFATDAQPINIANVSPLINGNLCFAAPYLFLFGSNGWVQFSDQNNPFSFQKDNGFSATTDKVIYGRAIRGGLNVPSLLLWSLSSVIRVTNTGNTANGIAIFKPETIANDTSILSSKSVVEYNGFFFWPGTDRFFVYNGYVDEIENTQNQDFFFDNLDLERRNQVFGVKNAKYAEIWWFYPVKGVAGNSRALVFNRKRNFWYDVAISREAGTYSNNFGFMATYGAPITNPDGQGYLWRHEFNIDQQKVIDNAQPVIEPILSYFLLPLFSWVAFPPKITKTSEPTQFVNRWVDLQRIEPDFVNTSNPSRFELVVSTKEYAQSKAILSNAIQFDSDTEKIDMHIQGRNMALKFSSNQDFEVGQIQVLLGLGDGR